jgi:tRNA nucleotidyltransferase (CCA-adding enzyme)
MRNAVKMGFAAKLSGGRVLSELILILQEDDPVPAVKRMRDFDLLRFLHPNLKFTEETGALFERIHHVLSWFDYLFLEEKYERWLIYFYGLIDLLKEEEVAEVCQRLSMNEKEKTRIIEGKKQTEQTLLQLFSWISSDYSPKRSEIYTILGPLSTESKLFMMAKTTQVATRRYISLYFTQLKDAKPLLKGVDLIRLGIQPGPEIKRNLANLLKARLDEQLITREDEMAFLVRSLEMSNGRT